WGSHCYYQTNNSKKFSVENNMDPGEVPEEIKNLNNVEEILIAQ
ncbi:6885_t:CDS:2, partial [Gigaspora rosea]